MTCEQFDEIDKHQLIDILLRYQLHFLAYQICKFEKFQNSSDLISDIYIDWACCKIGSHDSDQQICNSIKKHSNNNLSFTEIAQRAIQLKKEKLAFMLINQEPDIDKRVALFICTRNFEKAVYIASEEQNTNLLNLIILKMFKLQPMNFTEMFRVFKNNKRSMAHLIQFLKVFERKKLGEFLKELQLNDQRGVEMIKSAYQEDMGIKEKIRVMEEAVKIFSKGKQNFKAITQQYSKFLSKKYSNQKFDFKEQPLAISLQNLFKQGKLDQAQDFSVVTKVPEQRYQIYKLKHFANKGNWKKFDQVVYKYNANRNNLLIPFDEVAMICKEYGDMKRAEKYIMQYDDLDDKIYFLKGIGKDKAAAKLAFENKNIDYLFEIQQCTQDNVLISEIDDYLKILKA